MVAISSEIPFTYPTTQFDNNYDGQDSLNYNPMQGMSSGGPWNNLENSGANNNFYNSNDSSNSDSRHGQKKSSEHTNRGSTNRVNKHTRGGNRKVRKDPSPSSKPASDSTKPIDFSATIMRLLLASTEVERINILQHDSNFTFNFLDPPQNTPITTGKGGKMILANRRSFPALIGKGMSMSIGIIGPCGMNTPHIHPRATELNLAINGTFETGFITENGDRQILNKIGPGAVAIFPKGSIHWEANLDCDTILFLAAFDNEDPGTTSIAQSLFSIDEQILSATLGGLDGKTLKKIKSIIPKNIAMGLKECIKKCGLPDEDSSKEL